MGEVRVQLQLENAEDRILANAGHLEEARVRDAHVEALVDTGSVMILLPQELVERLGLPTNGSMIVTLANEQRVEMPVARHLSLAIGDRRWDTDCLVGPPQSEALVGQLVLERLDLIVDPLRHTVTPRPESPFLPSVKLKNLQEATTLAR